MRVLRIAVATLVLVSAVSCKSTETKDPLLNLAASESLVQGKALFEKKKYAQARKYFQHAFEAEPNSSAGREGLLLAADTLYLQGSNTNLIQSEAKYRDFQNRFPTSDRAPYVQFQIARSLVGRITTHVILIGGVLVMLLPLVWMACVSLLTPERAQAATVWSPILVRALKEPRVTAPGDVAGSGPGGGASSDGTHRRGLIGGVSNR